MRLQKVVRCMDVQLQSSFNIFLWMKLETVRDAMKKDFIVVILRMKIVPWFIEAEQTYQ